MKIESLKDLESVLKLCRKQGVTNITIDGITVELGELPEPKELKSEKQTAVPSAQPFTEDDLLFWSSTDRA